MFRWCLVCVVGACVCVSVCERVSGVYVCVCGCVPVREWVRVWVLVRECARVMYSDSIPLQ